MCVCVQDFGCDQDCLCVWCLQDFWWVFKIFLPLRWTPGPPLRRTAQNFALFFLSRRKFHSFFSLWRGLLVEFWWCLKRRGAQMCAFGVLWLLCEAPAAPKPPGFHTTAQENAGPARGMQGGRLCGGDDAGKSRRTEDFLRQLDGQGSKHEKVMRLRPCKTWASGR